MQKLNRVPVIDRNQTLVTVLTGIAESTRNRHTVRTHWPSDRWWAVRSRRGPAQMWGSQGRQGPETCSHWTAAIPRSTWGKRHIQLVSQIRSLTVSSLAEKNSFQYFIRIRICREPHWFGALESRSGSGSKTIDKNEKNIRHTYTPQFYRLLPLVAQCVKGLLPR